MRRLSLLLLLLGLSGCTSLFFYPQKRHVLTPDELDLAYRDVSLESSGGVTLHGWFLPAKAQQAVGTVLFLHGNAENISTHIASVYWLPAYDFNVFLLDYRGYGASQGKPDLAGLHDDIDCAIAYLLKQTDPNRLVIFGQSLGGALAIYALAHSPHRNRIRALVIESAFSSYRRITREKLASFWLTWPLQWPLSLPVGDAYSPLEAIARVSPVPILIVHGGRDRIVPVHHAYRLHERAAEPKQLWILPHGGHIQAFRDATYRQRLIRYLREVLGDDEPSSTKNKARLFNAETLMTTDH